ncbi:MAG: hypothetical protein Q9164_006354, partial [Protoblastenia rupestris]
MHTEQLSEESAVSVQELVKATSPHQPPSQPITHALTTSKNRPSLEKWVTLGDGMLFVKQQYVRRLELENGIYRRHLHALERDLYSNALENIADVLGLQQIQSRVNANGAPERAFASASLQKPGNGRPSSRTDCDERI